MLMYQLSFTLMWLVYLWTNKLTVHSWCHYLSLMLMWTDFTIVMMACVHDFKLHMSCWPMCYQVCNSCLRVTIEVWEILNNYHVVRNSCVSIFGVSLH